MYAGLVQLTFKLVVFSKKTKIAKNREIMSMEGIFYSAQVELIRKIVNKQRNERRTTETTTNVTVSHVHFPFLWGRQQLIK